MPKFICLLAGVVVYWPGAKGEGMMDRLPEPDIGRRLRLLRQRRGLSQRALARLCGLSANAIGLIERGTTSPSVSTLHRLALALGVPIADLFNEPDEDQSVVMVRREQRARVERGQVTMEILAGGLSEQCMEPFLATLQPGAGSGAEPVVHLGDEFVFCLEG
ncbi:MAG TPA: helix-turn-helix domain-containing protein, partial [Anaerolineae bacterium]|nr:helix-turn-helix domain-containing protein [Anaerolineae bacterium]